MDFIKALCLVTLAITIYDFKTKMYDLKNKKNEFHSAVEQIDRLPTYIVPTNYNIKLILHFEKNYTAYTLEGETSIRIHIYQKTQYIYLHQYFLDIFDTPTLINEDNGNSYELLWEQHMYNSILTFYLTEDLSPGFYILNMKFYGMPVHPKENVFNSFINGTDVM